MDSKTARNLVLAVTAAVAAGCFVMGRHDLAMRSLGWIILGIAALAYVSNRWAQLARRAAEANTPRKPTPQELEAYANPTAEPLPARVPATVLRYRLRRLAQMDSDRGWADELEGHLADSNIELQFFFSGEQWVAAGRIRMLDCALGATSMRRLLADAPISSDNAERIARRREPNIPNVLLWYNGSTLSVAPPTAVADLRVLLFAPIMGDPADFDAYMDRTA